ncbi:MAG: outer membrane lipoprotein chaperone LolA [Gammaproteobacteria bacterium]
MPLSCRPFILLSLVLLAVPVHAEVDTIVAYLNRLDSFSAAFTQERFDEEGALLERASGTARIERPGRFRWTYDEPYPQLIVSDGETLWIYDEDLEQVTVSAVDAAGAGSPAALLGHESDVAAQYSVTALETTSDGLVWYRLEPKGAASDFSGIELGFGEGEVRAMRLVDNLGQLTALGFNDIVRNRDLDDALFRFSPPPGVDVVQGGMP